MKLEQYPFSKLRTLLKDSNYSGDNDLIDLTIGEPKFGAPKFIQDALKENTSFLGKYPSIVGIDDLQNSICEFIKKRYDISIQKKQLCTTLGTKEVCFNFPLYYLYDIKNPTMAFTNPFYAIYEGASIVAKSETIYIDLNEQNNFTPKMNEDKLKKVNLVILNSPNNPTSSTMNIDELEKWVHLALKYDFFLINDECYSEIYRNTPPPSLLQASIKANNPKFKNIAVINSLSKRSSIPGIRSGYIIGDEEVLKGYKQYRTYVGSAQPEPLQIASTIAWRDEEHVKNFRNIYNKNFDLVKNILGLNPPEAGFFLYLKVNNDTQFTKILYEKENIKVLPASFMGKNNQGCSFVRIALVYENKIIQTALNAIKKYL
jgi:aspartate/methionine/tyrosine aminotransferase